MRQPGVDLRSNSMLKPRLKICEQSAYLRLDHDGQIVPDMINRACEPDNRIRRASLLSAHRALFVENRPKLRGKEFKIDCLGQKPTLLQKWDVQVINHHDMI